MQQDPTNTTIAFCVFKFFPYGGLQRDFLRIATSCRSRGHPIRVYTLSWEGDEPDGFEIIRVVPGGLSNHARYRRFASWVSHHLERYPVRCVVGFNKMPGLDVYFAADSCFAEKARLTRSSVYRATSRYRFFSQFERAVFDPVNDTEIILIAAAQRDQFKRYYSTPGHRFHLLPPGVNADRRRPANAAEVRAKFRSESGIGNDELLILLIGSGFITKGLDRALRAIQSLPAEIRCRTRLFVIGEDAPGRFQRLARKVGIADQVRFFKGRDDIPAVLQGGDLLLHPAYMESGGIVLLEALVAGLPVVTTDVCGFAPHVVQADAGLVIPSPYSQSCLDSALCKALESEQLRTRWAENGLAYAERADIYSQHERAADVIETVMTRRLSER